MIYDCFNFYNELDILDIRFNLLNDVVDKFVIAESTKTFSGLPKNLIFEENKKFFEKFLDKVIHIVIDDTPENFEKIEYISDPSTDYDERKNIVLKRTDSTPGWSRHEKQWGREIYQRESLIHGLKTASSSDICMLSDVDEIPDPKIVKSIKENLSDDVIDIRQKMFFYHIDLLKEERWSGTKVFRYKKAKEYSMNELRANKATTKTIENGGWHISFMGGLERIKSKIGAYSHQEFNHPLVLSNIEKNISNKKDLFFRNGQLVKVDLNDIFPEEMISFVRTKYPYLIS